MLKVLLSNSLVHCLIVLIVALLIRLSGIGDRPLQYDEAVNFHLSQSIEKGFYNYDHSSYHGPIHFYIIYFFSKLFPEFLADRQEWVVRLSSLIPGILVCLLPFCFIYLDRRNKLLGGLLLALNPSLVFLSKVAIHEMLYVLVSQILLILIMINRRYCYSWMPLLYGMVIALGIGVKENFLLFLAILTVLYQLIYSERGLWQIRIVPAFKIFIGCALVLPIIYWQGNLLFDWLEPFKGLLAWSQVGVSGNNQVQPFSYYFSLLLKAELHFYLLLAYLIPTVSGLKLGKLESKSKDIIFLLLTSLTQLIIYSILTYKTPWLIINFITPIILAITLAIESRLKNWQVSLIALIFVGQIFILTQDHSNKPNQLQPIPSYLEVRELSEEIERFCKNKKSCRVAVMADEYWPIPFYLANIGATVSYLPKNVWGQSTVLKNFDLLIKSTFITPENNNKFPTYTIHGRLKVNFIELASIYTQPSLKLPF